MNKLYSLVLLLAVTSLSYAQSGVLDTSFGTNGFVNTVVNGTYNYSKGSIVQPDGKIVVVGQAGEASTYKAFATRYNTDGTLDTSFGTNGSQVVAVGPVKSFATDVALQADGKIVVSGYTWDDVTGDIFVIRFNADGTFDNTFGSDGISIADNSTDVSETVAIQNDGKILVGGYTDDNFTVARFNTDGTIDTSFGANGWSMAQFGSPSYTRDLALQADGKIVLSGFAIGSVYQFAAARLNADGTIDNTFGTNGMVAFNIGSGNDFGEAVAVQNDGKILIGGHKWISNIGLKHDLAVVRLNADGSFDNTYGNNGVAIARIVDGSNYADDILLQPDGKVIIAGYTVLNNAYDLAMARFNTDGSLDNTFGTDGMVNTDFNGREDYASAIALQPDHKIILAGNSFDNGASEILVARYDNIILGTENFQNVEFRLYPNPANEQITIELSDASSNYQVEIFDILGKKVFASQIQKIGNINVSALASGTYLVKLNSDNKTSVIRFVKQ